MKKLLFLLLVGMLSSFQAAEITLAENGKAKAVIVIPTVAKPIVKLAAQELSGHLMRMTGAEFAVGTQAGDDVSIYLGFGDAEGFANDEYLIEAKGNRIDIYGKDTPKNVDHFNYFYDNPDKGTLRGVHAFLDSLGVRWLAPGDENTYVPERKTLRVPEQKVRFKPHFKDREIVDGWDFMRKYPDAKEYVENTSGFFLWGIRNNVSTRNMVPGCHSEHSLRLYENADWLAHPTAHQLQKNGKRNPNYSCWTDPYTKEVWMRAADGYFAGKSPQECGFNLKGYINSKWPYPFFAPDEFMIDMMDHDSNNDGRCWCERCQAFREKHPCEDDTEIIWQVLGDIANQIGAKYPGRYISTLVYPPKKGIPTSITKPKNVRVRICLPGPRDLLLPEQMASNMRKLKEWGDFLGPENIPLWVYQCAASFGRALPGVLDTYPHLISRYCQTVKPLCAGMFCENHNLTHTYHNLDVYIYMRLMWNPDRDVDKELEEYFRLYYGPAAVPARQLFARFEENWFTIDKEILHADKTQLGVVSKDKVLRQKRVWKEVYTQEEMKWIDSQMQQIHQLAPEGSIYAKRANMLQKYLVDVMKNERSEVMDKEEQRRHIKLNVASTTSEQFPSEKEWDRATECRLISADRMVPKLQAQASFRMMASGSHLFIRAVMEEPLMSDSKTDKARESGDNQIWMDNCIEFFFYSETDKRFWQILVNDNNAWSSQTKMSEPFKWEQMNGFKVKTAQTEKGWTASISIPLKELGPDKKLRFNCTRERNVKGQDTELSTWSPLAMVGNWHGVDNYGTLIFEKP